MCVFRRVCVCYFFLTLHKCYDVLEWLMGNDVACPPDKFLKWLEREHQDFKPHTYNIRHEVPICKIAL